ncbi:ribosomal-protein-alanine N-acetyltransferase [bacterium]|nr:ribosomal-protein-alanine N-acetyltransferase [bacterium]
MQDRAPRQVKPGDAQALSLLHGRCFAVGWSAGDLAAWIERPACAAAAIEDGAGALIAFGIILVAAEEGDVLTIAVDPGFRGRGVGRRLLDDLIDRARRLGARRVVLEVGAGNIPAIRLYRSLGFVEIARRAGYYVGERAGEDALVMEWVRSDPSWSSGSW